MNLQVLLGNQRIKLKYLLRVSPLLMLAETMEISLILWPPSIEKQPVLLDHYLPQPLKGNILRHGLLDAKALSNHRRQASITSLAVVYAVESSRRLRLYLAVLHCTKKISKSTFA